MKQGAVFRHKSYSNYSECNFCNENGGKYVETAIYLLIPFDHPETRRGFTTIKGPEHSLFSKLERII